MLFTTMSMYWELDANKIIAAMEEWICPLTHEVPIDPTIAEDGHTMSRDEYQHRYGSSEPDENKIKAALNVLEEYCTCALTGDFPIDPKLADDGCTYEGCAIEEFIAAHKENDYASLRSPTTNLPMGPSVMATQTGKEFIESLIRTGAFCGDKAESWTRRTTENVLLTRVREDADPRAMLRLGLFYFRGSLGVWIDQERASGYWVKAAKASCMFGLAVAGIGFCAGL